MKNKLKSYFIVNGKFLDSKNVDFTANLYTTNKNKIQELDDDENKDKDKKE